MLAIGLLCFSSLVHAQTAAVATEQPAVTLAGVVVDAQGRPVASAAVKLQGQSDAHTISATTDSSGHFSFAAMLPGTYLCQTSATEGIDAEKVVLSAGATPQLRIVLHARDANGNVPPVAGQALEFSDKPSFSVAGVSDWTAVGGHGSDAVLRTSEALTRDTAALAAPSEAARSGTQQVRDEAQERELLLAVQAAPATYKANHDLGSYYLRTAQYDKALPLLQQAAKLSGAASDDNYTLALAYQGTHNYTEARELVGQALAQRDLAQYEHLAGQVDEQLGDPLGAVRHLQLATRLDPSEQNYFDFGSELLLHRAIWQAVQTFADGAKAYPGSVRLRTGWGAALFAGALYAQSARQLCDASELEVNDVATYLLLGQVAVASPQLEPCIRQSLERFLRLAPTNAQAHYFLAMSLKKTNDAEGLQRSHDLFQQAVLLEPNYAEAHVQLGMIAFGQHHYPEAVEEYKKAVAANPALGEAHYRLAVAYDRTGHLDLARQQFQLHDQLEKAEGEAVEQQRRHITQFVMTSPDNAGGVAKP